MTLSRLIYASTMDNEASHRDIDDILNTAKHYNKKNHITGALFFSSKFFIQCLEGEREVVSRLFQTICQDTRHRDVVLLNFSETNSRDFEQWSMGYIPASSATASITLKYSINGELNPYIMIGDTAYSLLLDLRESLQTI